MTSILDTFPMGIHLRPSQGEFVHLKKRWDYIPSPMTTLMTSIKSSVTIFHPILAEFKYDLVKLSTFDPPSRHAERTVEFVVKSLERKKIA